MGICVSGPLPHCVYFGGENCFINNAHCVQVNRNNAAMREKLYDHMKCSCKWLLCKFVVCSPKQPVHSHASPHQALSISMIEDASKKYPFIL